MLSSEQQRTELLAARTEDAADTDDLTSAQVQREITELRAADPGHGQHRRTSLIPVRRGRVGDLAASDQRDHRVVIEPADGLLGHHPPVAQHDYPVGEGQDFVQPVGDEHHPGPRRRDPPDRLEQHLDLIAGQRRRRLVQHQDVVRTSPVVQRPGDRDDRPLRRRQPSDRDRHIQAGPKPGDELPGSATLGGAADGGESPPVRRLTQPQVFYRRQDVGQAEILVDEVQFLASRWRRHQLAVGVADLDDRPRIGFIDTGQDLDQRRFARAVVSQHRDDFPWMNL